MSKESPIPIQIPPGVVKTQSPLSGAGRFTDCSWVRFWRGKAQKIGGYVMLDANGPVLGVPCGATSWSDSSIRQLVAVGTQAKFYYLSNVDYNWVDITPIRTSATLANPITTAIGVSQVTINYPGNESNVGDYVNISGAASVGGLDMNGSWLITEIVDVDNFKVQAGATASGSATGGGASVLIEIEISAGSADPTTGYGWGAGPWDEGTWGTPRLVSGIVFTPRQWTMGNFGKVLIFCPNNGALYSFDPSVLPTQRGARIEGAPTVNTGVVVTSDNIVIAYGSSYDPAIVKDGGPIAQNLLQWWSSRQGDYTDWDVTGVADERGAPPATNTVREGTRFVGGVDLGTHVTLIWTDTALYAFQYTGSAYVFNVQLVGKECGLIGPHAMVQVEGQAFWMSPHGFKLFNGGVSPIPNSEDISEWVIQNLRVGYTAKTICWYNQRYNEVWWAFVTAGQSTPTLYVAVNRSDWTWTKGTLPQNMASASRFTGYDARPLVFGANGRLYQMDNGLSANGVAIPWYLETGAAELPNGVQHLEPSGIAMDMERQVGTITALIQTYDRSPADETLLDSDSATFGPTDELVDLRVSGRIATLRWSGGGGVNDDFRFGVPKLLLSGGGKRR